MKNIIFFILIILFFFSSVEQETEPTFAQQWEQVKKKSSEDAINFLKESGYYEFLINLLKVYDKEVAIKICGTKLETKVCEDIISFLLALIN